MTHEEHWERPAHRPRPEYDRPLIYGRPMAESVLTVAFGGPTSARGRIAVRDLAPALLALDEIVADASILVDPDRKAAMLSIDRIETGSPTIHLMLSIAEHADRLTNLLAPAASTVLADVHDVVTGPRGLLQLTRAVRNRAIVQCDPAAEPGVTRVLLQDDEALEARDEAIELYLDRGARRNANAVIRPLRRLAFETLEVSSPTSRPTLITELDADAFDLPPTEPVCTETEVEMLVDVAAPAFPSNNKWRLSNGTAGSFWSTIGDGAFLNRVNAGEPFRKGDSLRCLFKITRRETTLGPQIEHHVVEVRQHIARGQQLRLDEAA